MSKRLFEFAKELGLPSKDILDRCKKLGHNIPSQLTVIDEKIQSEVRRDLGLADIHAVSAPAPAPAAGPKTATAPKTAAGAAPSGAHTMVKPATLSAPTATYPTLKPGAPKPAFKPTMVARKSGPSLKPL